MFNEIAFMSLGAVIGTVWWLIFIFYIFKPQIAQLRTDIEGEKDRIEKKIDVQLEKIPDINATINRVKTEIQASLPNIDETIATVKTDIKAEIDGVIGQIKAELPDVEGTIASVKADIKAEIENIKTEIDVKEFMKPLIAELNKPMQEWDPDMLNAVANVTGGAVNQVLYAIENDERINEYMNNKAKGLMMNFKKEFRSEMTEAVPEIAKGFGIDPAMITQGADMLENIPEDYRWIVQMFMLYQKGGMPMLGGGSPTDYYGGY
jgi:hypothetical protein